VLTGLQARPAKMIVRAAYNDGRGADWLAERTQLPDVVLPFTVGGNEQAKDLFSLFDDTVHRLLKALP
jgi:zinc/manganese transport system substrate-binding protein